MEANKELKEKYKNKVTSRSNHTYTKLLKSYRVLFYYINLKVDPILIKFITQN